MTADSHDPAIAAVQGGDPSMEASAMDLWPRIEQAINAAGINRFNAEWCLPRCHRKGGKMVDPGQLDRLYGMFVASVRDSVHAELLCRATSEPDVGGMS